MTVEKTNLGRFSEWSLKNCQFVSKGGIFVSVNLVLLLFVTEFHAANVLIAAHFVNSSFVSEMSRSEHLKFGFNFYFDCDNSSRLYVNIADDELFCCVPVEELICKLFFCFLHI